MKRALSLVLSLVGLILALGGCEKTPPPPADAVLFQAIQDNVNAMEKKDVDAVMATIHPKAPAFDSTRNLATQMFAALDVKYTLSDLKVVVSSPDEARVSFVQKMEKTGGEGQFQNNIMAGIHILRPDGGKWKIFNTIPTKVTGLDGKPLGVSEATSDQEAPQAPAPASAKPAPAAATAPTANPATTTESAPKAAAPAEKPPQ